LLADDIHVKRQKLGVVFEALVVAEHGGFQLELLANGCARFGDNYLLERNV
jgi:hypothetical protein